MIPVYQTICNFQTGNCFQACVASIFELPLEKVPNFMMGGQDHFETHLSKWCDDLGIVALDVTFKSDHLYKIKDCFVIATGKSPGTSGPEWDEFPEEFKEKHKEALHCVVWNNGKMVHDPTPDGKGLAGPPMFYTVFIIKDSGKFFKNGR